MDLFPGQEEAFLHVERLSKSLEMLWFAGKGCGQLSALEKPVSPIGHFRIKVLGFLLCRITFSVPGVFSDIWELILVPMDGF